jgi:hypothetical protein
MRIKHPGLEFMVCEIADQHPSLDRETLRAAAEHADDVAFHTCEVGTVEEVSSTYEYFRAASLVGATPEARAIYGTAADWAAIWVNALMRGNDSLMRGPVAFFA